MNIPALFKPITTFIFDVDGVMTDGSIQLLENGELSRKMNIKDGFAIHYAIEKGYRIAVISGGGSPNVENRLRGLGVQDIYMKVSDKKEKMEDYFLMQSVLPEEILYMGDDLPDLEVLQMAGLATCPADAAEEVKAVCHYISPYDGGCGCVRDVVEKVMKLKGNW